MSILCAWQLQADTTLHPGTYLLLFFSLMWSLVSRICPFLSQVICGGGSPWATHVKMAVVPTGLEMDWGCCTNSAGAVGRKKERSQHDYTLFWHEEQSCSLVCIVLGTWGKKVLLLSDPGTFG